MLTFIYAHLASSQTIENPLLLLVQNRFYPLTDIHYPGVHVRPWGIGPQSVAVSGFERHGRLASFRGARDSRGLAELAGAGFERRLRHTDGL